MRSTISLREKIGSMLMFGFSGVEASQPHVKIFIDKVKKYNLGGVILFGYNILSPEQLSKLTQSLKEAGPNLFIAVDQEGGKIQRLKEKQGFVDTPSVKYIADNCDTEDAYDIYYKMSKMLKGNGINLNFAPCVDVNAEVPCAVIGGLERSYGCEPEKVIKYSKILIKAHQENGILTSLKHFPGHGFAKGDTHEDLVDVTEVANPEIELTPYKEILAYSDDFLVMTAHIVNKNLDSDGLPATLSKKMINGVLRKDLGFQGVVITDALEMGAIKNHYSLEEVIEKAINAGNDMLMFSANDASSPNSQEKSSWCGVSPSKVIDIIESGISKKIIPIERIDESYTRIMELKNNFITQI